MSKFAINEEFLQQIEALQMLLKNNLAGLFGGNHQIQYIGKDKFLSIVLGREKQFAAPWFKRKCGQIE